MWYYAYPDNILARWCRFSTGYGVVTTLCDVMQHHLSRSEWDEARQERSRHCLPQTSSTTQPFSPVCPSAVSPLAFFCIFFYIFYIFTSTVSSTSHFVHFFSLTPSPHHCLSLKLQTNCVLFVKSKLRKTLDFVNGAPARFWAVTYKAVKTQPVHAKGQLLVN